MMRPFPRYPLCPVCGDPAANPASLGVVWLWDDQVREVTGRFVPGPLHAGYEGVLHGGLLASLLDECLAWACAAERGTYFVTGELSLRYKRPATLGDELAVVGRAPLARGPYVRATGEVRRSDGAVLVTARATFVAMPRERAIELRAALHTEPGDLDVLAHGNAT